MQNQNDNISVDGGFDGLDYSFSDNSKNGYDVTVQGERGLWCAVIEQAISDISNKDEGREAKIWLFRNNQDFVTVCSLAGLSPVAVRRAALQKLNNL